VIWIPRASKAPAKRKSRHDYEVAGVFFGKMAHLQALMTNLKNLDLGIATQELPAKYQW